MPVNITIDTKDLNKAIYELDKVAKREAPKAIKLALNRTLDFTATQYKKGVTERYTIKSKEVSDNLKKGKHYAKESDLTAYIRSVGHRLSFAHFPYSPKTDIRGKKGAVKVSIKKSKRNVKSRNGFVATTGAKSADKTQFNVFRRLTKKRYPIAPIRTLSIPQMVGNDELSKRLQPSINKKLEERLAHETKRALDRMKGV
jgi:hypothetical protein